MQVLKRTALVCVVYCVVVAGWWWGYWSCHMKWKRALLFSVDTIACRGRMSDPEENENPAILLGRTKTIAAFESVIGHLGLAVVIGLATSLPTSEPFAGEAEEDD
jgi:hypothetical protein